ncbi:MAG: PQQ-binding-like beta-propeller repeat protein [Lacipirellulaceae bacterium]
MPQLVLRQGFSAVKSRPESDRLGSVGTRSPGRETYLTGRSGAGLAAAIFLGIFAPSPSQSAPAAPETPNPAAESELYYGSRLPADRDKQRALDVARQLLDEGRPSDALPLVDRALAADEDSADTDSRSLRHTARELIDRLTPAQQNAYRLLFELEAQRLTADAAARRDGATLARLAARFPPSQLGAPAWLAWAELEAERGHYAAAAAIGARAKSDVGPDQRERLGPRLSALVEQNAQRVAPIDAPPTPTASGATRWWSSRRPAAWLGSGGDFDRKAEAPAGAPVAWRTWRCELLDDRAAARRLDRIDAHATLSNNPPRVSAAGLVAVEGTLVTPTAQGLVAIDAASGKRLWRTTRRDAPREGASLPEWNESGGPTLDDPLASGAWLDRVHGSITTDGHRAFVVDRSSIDGELVTVRWNPQRGMFGETPSGRWVNALEAYAIATQGKLAWRLDGGEPGSPVEGAYFLGAPTPFEGRLWSLAEVQQQITLLEIDAESGAVVWRQTLASLERGVAENARLRVLGAAPTVSQGSGLVLCPTGGGMIVAIDPWSRSIAWSARIGVEAEDLRGVEGRGWASVVGADTPLDGGRGWREARVLVDGGVAVVATPESPRLWRLDVQTGAASGEAVLPDGVLLVAARHGVAVVVESAGLSAWSLSDGSMRWRVEFPPGVAPTGEGLLLAADDADQARYVTPLQDGRLSVVRLRDNSSQVLKLLPDPLDEPLRLGTAAFHRGALVFRSPVGLERYDLTPAGDAPPSPVARVLAALARGDSSEGSRLAAEADEPRLQQAADLERARELDASSDTIARFERQASGREVRTLAAALRFRAAVAAGDAPEIVKLAAVLGEANRSIRVRGTDNVSAARWVAGQVARIEDPRVAGRVAELALERAQSANTTAELAALGEAFATLEAGSVALARLADRAAARGEGATADRLKWIASRRTPEAPLDGDSVGAAEVRPSGPGIGRWQVATSTAVQSVVEPTRDRVPQWQRQRIDLAGVEGEALAGVRVSDPSPGTPVAWRMRSDQSDSREVVGASDVGERVFAAPLPTIIDPRRSDPAVGRPSDWHWGPLLVLRVGEHVRAYACDRQTDGEPLWTTEERGTSEAAPIALEEGVESSSEAESPAAPTFASTLASTLGSGDHVVGVGPFGVVIAGQEGLACHDPLTGAELWRRATPPPFTRAIVAGDRLYVAPDVGAPAVGAADEAGGAALSLIDGASLGQWTAPEGVWLSAASRHVLASERGDNAILRVVDVATGDERWRGATPASSALVRFAGRGDADSGLAVTFDARRRVTLVDVRRGAERFSVALPPPLSAERGDAASGKSAPPSVACRVDGDRLYVTVGRFDEAAHRAAGYRAIDAPLVTGEVHALDARTGASLWPHPVELDAQGWLDLPLSPAPVLAFASLRTQTGVGGDESFNRLVVLDAVTGRTLYRNDLLPTPITGGQAVWAQSELLGRSGTMQRVTLRLGTARVTLESTGAPRPPRPPSIARVEAPAPPAGGDLMGVGRDLGKLFEQMIVPSR